MDDANKKSSKRFLVIYCLAIFIFAVALILITYVSQTRSAAAMNALNDQLSTSEMSREQLEDEVKKLNESITSLTTENEALTTEKETLTTENEALKTEKAELEKKLVASQKLSALISIKLDGSKSEFRAALETFEAEGHPALLSPEELEIYNAIK